MSSQVRIIAGKYRSQKIQFSNIDGLRPTSNRLRETLFNWLQFDLINKNVLDLFAGSGALAFEALSRGANCATLIEANSKAHQDLCANQKYLKLENVDIVHQDAYQFIAESQTTFDLIFVDPPFNKTDWQSLISLLDNSVLVGKNTQIYLESATKINAEYLPKGWRILQEKQVASVHALLIEVE